MIRRQIHGSQLRVRRLAVPSTCVEARRDVAVLLPPGAERVHVVVRWCRHSGRGSGRIGEAPAEGLGHPLNSSERICNMRIVSAGRTRGSCRGPAAGKHPEEVCRTGSLRSADSFQKRS